MEKTGGERQPQRQQQGRQEGEQQPPSTPEQVGGSSPLAPLAGRCRQGAIRRLYLTSLHRPSLHPLLVFARASQALPRMLNMLSSLAAPSPRTAQMRGLRVQALGAAELRALVAHPQQACWYYLDLDVSTTNRAHCTPDCLLQQRPVDTQARKASEPARMALLASHPQGHLALKATTSPQPGAPRSSLIRAG